MNIYFLSRLLPNLLDSNIQLSHRACTFLRLVHFLMVTHCIEPFLSLYVKINDCNFILTSQQPGIGGEG